MPGSVCLRPLPWTLSKDTLEFTDSLFKNPSRLQERSNVIPHIRRPLFLFDFDPGMLRTSSWSVRWRRRCRRRRRRGRRTASFTLLPHHDIVGLNLQKLLVINFVLTCSVCNDHNQCDQKINKFCGQIYFGEKGSPKNVYKCPK